MPRALTWRMGLGIGECPLLLGLLDLAPEFVGVGVNLLGKHFAGTLGGLLDLLVDPRLADDDYRRLALVQGLAKLLQVATRHTAPQVPGDAACGPADDRAADDR